MRDDLDRHINSILVDATQVVLAGQTAGFRFDIEYSPGGEIGVGFIARNLMFEVSVFMNDLEIRLHAAPLDGRAATELQFRRNVDHPDFDMAMVSSFLEHHSQEPF